MTDPANAEESVEGAVLEGLYRVGPVLREGGMGTVHEALQIRLNKRVAIKVMARELAGDAEALVRFRREAEITSAIGHPHIVQILDFGTTPAGAPFLVMELLEGEDLEHRLERVGHLEPEAMLRIVKQVASALAAVHAKGVVHRDLKPANIFLLDVAGEQDFVKVLDFGVSKMGSEHTGVSGGTKVLGTPRYMSREQAQGLMAQIDERTDEWALACIAWEAVSGQPPFVGDDNIALLYQVVHETPAPLVTAAPGNCFALEQVLRRALAKDKGERFAHVTDFACALEKAVVEGNVAGAQADLPSPHKTEWQSGHTLRLVPGQWPPPEALLGAAPARGHSLSANRNLPSTLRAARRHRARVELPRRESPGMKWLWPFAAAALVFLLGGMPAKPPADEMPRPIDAARTQPSPVNTISVSDPVAKVPSATVAAEPTATPPMPSTPTNDSASESGRDRPPSATAAGKDRALLHGRTGTKPQATTVGKEPLDPSTPEIRPRLPLEQRLIREL